MIFYLGPSQSYFIPGVVPETGSVIIGGMYTSAFLLIIGFSCGVCINNPSFNDVMLVDVMTVNVASVDTV